MNFAAYKWWKWCEEPRTLNDHTFDSTGMGNACMGLVFMPSSEFKEWF